LFQLERFKYRCTKWVHTTQIFHHKYSYTPNFAAMAEVVQLPQGATREELYNALTPQLSGLLSGETNLIANAANFSALVHTAFGFHWVGFYWVQGGELVLGPFQGPVACTRIARGKGVCGAAWLRNETVVVADVENFPGHIACSALSRSEIVVPVKNKLEEIIGVLDIDSSELNDFTIVDQRYLEQWVDMLAKACHV